MTGFQQRTLFERLGGSNWKCLALKQNFLAFRLQRLKNSADQASQSAYVDSVMSQSPGSKRPKYWALQRHSVLQIKFFKTHFRIINSLNVQHELFKGPVCNIFYHLLVRKHITNNFTVNPCFLMFLLIFTSCMSCDVGVKTTKPRADPRSRLPYRPGLLTSGPALYVIINAYH